MIFPNPILSLINSASQWAWQQVADNSTTILRRYVMHPLGWPPVLTSFYHLSQALAASLALAVLLVALLRLMWPNLSITGVSGTIRGLLERLVTGALVAVAGPWMVHVMLEINNALVGQLTSSLAVAGLRSPQGLLSPLVVGMVALALFALMIYLAVFYAARAVEIYLLTAMIPWVLLWWATQGDEVVLGRFFKELVVVIFVQSVHAATLWLIYRIAGAFSWEGVFLELALFWWMTRVPAEIRYLVGASSGVNRLWR
ncbi:MAG: hypothetical protein OWU84_07000 [Firmicutes bacterium]|nr:hypothetical protein [Bacillota bacterium]